MSKARKQKYEDVEDEEEEEEEEKEVYDLTKPKDHDFGLYARLNIDKSANQDQIKKAYRMTSLKVHPDKNPDDPEADAKFQKVNEAYVILSDERKRKHYDLTGEIDGDNLQDLLNKCRFFYKEFCAEDIDSFAKEYKNGPDEEADLIKFYNEHDGNLTQILNFIPLSENSDIERFLKIFDKLIKQKTIIKTASFTKSRNSIELLENEEAEFEEEIKAEKKRDKKGKKKQNKKEEVNFEELKNQILAKRGKGNSGNFLSALASKYGADDPMGDMPTEEEFQKVKQNIDKKKTKTSGKTKSKKNR